MAKKMRKSNSKNPGDIWQEFMEDQKKNNSNLSKIFSKAGWGGFYNKTVTLYLPDEASNKSARGQIEKLKKKLQPLGLVCDKIKILTGEVPKTSPATPTGSTKPQKKVDSKTSNPLQALVLKPFKEDEKGNELSQPVLIAAAEAEKSCNDIYQKLKQRTELLVGDDGGTMTVDFNWRLRVGGTRGFRELLLPVFHPVFGVPYIPPSSLKGAARAWARKNSDAGEVVQLLGMLDRKEAKAAKVEFLDAFPVKPCLSVDVATPQWSWENNRVPYDPKPHALLSMEQPKFLIGLRPTARGTVDDVCRVKEWLENALKTGIGSRVSSGYGRALGQGSSLPRSQSYSFELWTQGMYGVEPPSKDNGYQGVAEFRPTAVRGILRYWFRAVALGFYDAASCQELEDEIFGNLSKPGKVATGAIINPTKKTNPYLYEGRIYLEAGEEKYLNLLEKLLTLASHLGGVGRGSRRPLHLLNGRMRGCHWVVDANGFPLEGDRQKWQQFFNSLKPAFQAVKSPLGSHTSSPGEPGQGKRQQDVLDKNALIFLLKSPGQVPPEDVKNWQTEGEKDEVRGTALSLLYGDPKFKGESGKGKNKTGNPNVGGSLGTPSYVWIKSVFPYEKMPYQVVTIFGVDGHSDRLEFAKELARQGAELVYGEMPSNTSRPKPRRRR